MEQETMGFFKLRLLSELERIQGQGQTNLENLRGFGAQLQNEEEQLSGGKIIFLETKLSSRQRLYHKKIIKCLQKIEEGHYGLCEECQGDIDVQRLNARPVAQLCIQCKEVEELSEYQKEKAWPIA